MSSQSIEEKIIECISALPQSQDIGESLSEIKPLIMSAKPSQLLNVMDHLDLGPLLKQLYENKDGMNVSDITSVFGMILESLPTNYIVSHFQSEIISGLKSNNEPILELWLKQLDRCFADDTICRNTTVAINSILENVIFLIAHDSTSIAKYCHNILLKSATNGSTQSAFYSDELQENITVMRKKKDIIRMRVYDLLVTVANTSPLALNRIEERGHLLDLIEYFNHGAQNDPLITLNCSQIIADLASTSRGIEFLESAGSLKIIADKICKDSSDDPLGIITLPGYVKIFGTVAHYKSKIINEFPRVLKKIFTLFKEKDTALIYCAIDTIGVIGQNNDGKKILDSDTDMNEKCVKSLGSTLTCSSNELKVRTLSCLINLLQIIEPDPNGEATTITESWYNNLLPDKKITQIVISLCRQPISEIRLSSLELLRVLCTHVWGHKVLASFPGFLEYILDRSTEFDKDGKEAKYGIVRELVNSPFISLSFTREAIQQLRAYYKDGPYYIDTETAVAFEGAN